MCALARSNAVRYPKASTHKATSVERFPSCYFDLGIEEFYPRDHRGRPIICDEGFLPMPRVVVPVAEIAMLTFQRLNKIDDLVEAETYANAQPMDEPIEAYVKKTLTTLYNYRVELRNLALNLSYDFCTPRYTAIIREYRDLFFRARAQIQLHSELSQMDIEQAYQQPSAFANLWAAVTGDPTHYFRQYGPDGKKKKPITKADRNALLRLIESQRRNRFARLEEAMELLDKHRIFNTLSMHSVIWNSQGLRMCGRRHGRLWIPKVEAHQVVKTAPGVYKVQANFVIDEATAFYPTQVLVVRQKSGCFKTCQTLWKACTTHDFDNPVLDLAITVHDELMVAEFNEQGERTRL